MSLRTRMILVVALLLLFSLGIFWLVGGNLVAHPGIAVLLVLLLIAASGLALWASRSLQTPLKEISQAVKDIETGDFKPGTLNRLAHRSDELGMLANALDSMALEVSARDRRLKMLLRVIPAGVALSMESDFQCLLETIVVESQAITNADGGTLYILEDDGLKFVIMRNTSLKTSLGGTTGSPVPFPPLPMYLEKDGRPNHHNVATHAAHGREWVNIPDAYQAKDFDFSGTRAFDERTGYHSQSFLTIPLEGDEQQVIGVLQLINSIDPETGSVIPFHDDEVFKTLVLLASTALAGYIRQEKLRKEIEKLNIVIDQVKQARQVSEITETEYFRSLLEKAREIRFGRNN